MAEVVPVAAVAVVAVAVSFCDGSTAVSREVPLSWNLSRRGEEAGAVVTGKVPLTLIVNLV